MREVIQTRIVKDSTGREFLEYLTTEGKRYRHEGNVMEGNEENFFPAGSVNPTT